MAFVFAWPHFDDAFTDIARQALEHALNQGEKPTNIVETIHVRELSLGHQPPELTLLEITELSTDRFRGMFRLTYAGDAHVVLQTKVQINPVTPSHTSPHHPHSSMTRLYAQPAAQKPLHVPMALKISQVQLCGTCTLVTSRKRGITLSFKNDPLQKIKVESTFDEVGGVRDMLQREIESRLRRVCTEDLPSWIHKWSRRNLNLHDDDEALSPMKPLKLEPNEPKPFHLAPLTPRRPSVSAPTSPLASHRRSSKSLSERQSNEVSGKKPNRVAIHLRDTQSDITPPKKYASTTYLSRPGTSLLSPVSSTFSSRSVLSLASFRAQPAGLKDVLTHSNDSGIGDSRPNIVSSWDDLNVE